MSTLVSWQNWQSLPKAAGIYRIIHLTTGREYIGSAQDIRFRIGKHRRDLLTGKHHSPFLQRLFRKYGYNSVAFEVLEYVNSPEILLEREQFFIDSRKPALNSAPKADSCKGVKHTEETCRKRAAATKRNWEQKTELEKWAWGNVCSQRMKARWLAMTPEQKQAAAAKSKEVEVARIAAMTDEERSAYLQSLSQRGKKGAAVRGPMVPGQLEKVMAGQRAWRQNHPEEVAAMTARMAATKRAQFAKKRAETNE